MTTIRNYETVRKVADFVEDIKRMSTSDAHVGFDIESGYTGPDQEKVSLMPHHPNWILVSFSYTNGPHWARSVPIAHDNGDNVDDVPRTARMLWRMLNTLKIVPHNAMFEQTGTSRWFRETLWNDTHAPTREAVRASDGHFPVYSDSLIEARVLNQHPPASLKGEATVGQAGLKYLSKAELGQEMTEFEDLFPVEDTDMGPGTPAKNKKYIRFNTRFPASPRVTNYTCEDATAAWELSGRFRPDLEASDMWDIFQVEMLLQPVLIDMEKEALVLDWSAIHTRSEEIARFRDRYNEQIQQDLSTRTGSATPVLLSSPKQLSEVLFKPVEEGGLGLPITKRSKITKEPSSGNDALKLIAQKDPIIRDILTWRRVAKLYSAYLHKYDTQLNYAGNGRAYPNHKQIGAGTGRMSVDGVSYQQWPKPYHFELKDGTSFDLNFRDLLVAPEGFRIVGFDYSQIELRVLAGQAQEGVMIQSFLDGIDIHRATASTMLRIPLEEITKKHRSVGKTSNFAAVYQSGPGGIADGLSAAGTPTTKEQAEQMLKDYFNAFPKLRTYMDKLVSTGHEQGFVMTPFGRKFTIWEHTSPFDSVRAKGDRLCVNAPIQGGAADYLKRSMVRASKAIKKAGMADAIRLVLSVHDHLGFYVRDDVTDQQVVDLVDPVVTVPDKQLGGVPILADWHVGLRWGHVVEMKRSPDGSILGYVNEDDESHVFSTAEEAYARGLELDDMRMESYRVKIAERLARQAEEETLLAAVHQYEPGGSAGLCRACGEEYDYFEHALLTPEVVPVAPVVHVKATASVLSDIDDLLADVPNKIPDDDDEPSWAHAVIPTPVAEEEAVDVITIAEMPNMDLYEVFQKWIAKDGPNEPRRLLLETPEGRVELGTHTLDGPALDKCARLLSGAATEEMTIKIQETEQA